MCAYKVFGFVVSSVCHRYPSECNYIVESYSSIGLAVAFYVTRNVQSCSPFLNKETILSVVAAIFLYVLERNIYFYF